MLIFQKSITKKGQINAKIAAQDEINLKKVITFTYPKNRKILCIFGQKINESTGSIKGKQGGLFFQKKRCIRSVIRHFKTNHVIRSKLYFNPMLATALRTA